MEDQADSGFPPTGSASKMAGDKRGSDDLGEEEQEVPRKRVKMRNLDAVLRVPDADSCQVQRSGTSTLTLSAEVNPVHGRLDLNSEAGMGYDSTRREAVHNADNCAEVANKCETSLGTGLDLNAENIASSGNHNRVYPNKTHKSRQKSWDVSECASTTGPVVDKDPLKVWKEMKQNGFLSAPHGGISSQSNLLSSSSNGPPHGGVPVPKQRGRKPKNNDIVKKRMEIAKKEQVDRFTKIAAPSGLLNDLNPGIINHVRNSKQVRSIIEALVKSEKHETNREERRRDSYLKAGSKGIGGNESSSVAVFESKLMGGFTISSRECDSGTTRGMCGGSSLSYSHPVGEDALVLKLSSSMKVPEESSSFSNNGSADGTNASSLSVKAASVASQWLELVQQDIKGRLTALRRSKRRVKDVITTDLPMLISREFGSNQENSDPYNMHAAAMHQARWTQKFDQMDKALTEEQRQLESWLSQLKEMQLHCDHGLQHYQLNGFMGLQQPPGPAEHFIRTPKPENPEKELAVRAAAASIYSTCNFFTSKENVSCF
ncbi:unnamed protein product [Linum tenue]|uniref:Uncharacterized protein n=1 Tax=Linum tenue TaxID=586396 RepID=A0AAV0R753_9ROSI|nr:unnamed protein product [Linum tenue]